MRARGGVHIAENAAKYDSSIQFLSCIRPKKLKLDGPVSLLVTIIEIEQNRSGK